MRVILAEKKSMADAIAAGLGIKPIGKSHYEGKDADGRAVAITWAKGHLIELVNPEAYCDDWKNWEWSSLPMIPSAWKTQVVSDSADRFKAVKELLPNADELVVATDAGREGELIADLIVAKIGFKKPAFRLWTSSLTPRAIRDAYGALKPWSAYQGLRDAAQGRARADWLVGMSGTRGLSLLARNLGRRERGAWAVGRVMTPTLAILVQREKEISAFKAEDFWTLEAQFRHPAGIYKGTWFKGDQNRFSKEAEATAMMDAVKGRPARIVHYETKPVSKAPEQFYSLAAIQQEASKRFKFSVERTLEVVASLYEAKLMSYPRTSSRHLTEDESALIPRWLETLARLPQYGGLVGEIKPEALKLGKRFVDDAEVEDHSALMPTEETPNWDGLSEDQKKIYDLVARRFIAAFFPNRVEEKTVLITEVSCDSGPETFKSTGTVVVEQGWSRVDSPALAKVKRKAKGADEDDDDAPLALSGAPLAEGDGVDIGAATLAAKKTTPPKRLTDGDLIRMMLSAGKDLDDDELRAVMRDHKGIGTEATRANIIAKLLNNGTKAKPRDPLVVTEKGFLIPTERGISLIEMVPFQELTSAELTANWEKELDRIASNKETLAAFMARIEKYTHDMIATLREAAPSGASMTAPSSNASGAPAKILDFACPKCGSSVHLKAGTTGLYVKCSGDKGAKCYFGFDADADGTATISCANPACEHGRVKTTPNGSLVCGDCGSWQDKFGAAGAPSSTSSSCPKCKRGTIRVIKGANGPFAACSNRDGCGLTYGCKEDGKPEAGFCKSCKGPVKKTKSGSKICVVCDSWQDSKAGAGGGAGNAERPAKPADQACFDCGGQMKTLWTKKGKWAYLCEPCNAWHDAPGSAKGAPARK